MKKRLREHALAPPRLLLADIALSVEAPVPSSPSLLRRKGREGEKKTWTLSIVGACSPSAASWRVSVLLLLVALSLASYFLMRAAAKLKCVAFTTGRRL